MTEALGAALFHFLWQGAVLALIPALAMLFRSPRVRYGAACLALFAMPLAFAVTFVVSLPPGPSYISTPLDLSTLARSVGPSPSVARSFDFSQSLRWFVPFWVAGVVLFYLRTFVAWIGVQRLRRESSAPAPDCWRRKVRELAGRLNIRRAVALFGSDLVDVPVVAGFLRPAIFVPAALFTGMAPEQLEYLLIHELAHIRRFDYAVNLIQNVVEGLLFYHPAVWWVSRILRNERENCCDDAVVELRGNALEYATVLASLEQYRGSPALAAGGGNLANRVLRLLNRPAQATVLPLLVLLGLALTCTIGWAALQEGEQLPQLPVAPRPPAAPEVRRIAQARQQATPLPSPYEKWVTEDVAYIITKEEREAFRGLTTDAEREHFIEQFWARREPEPDFKIEYYRRIAYANVHFADPANLGWQSDRGRIYIVYGPPDEIDSHPNPAGWEEWQYKFIQGIGQNVKIRFEDTAHNGVMRMAKDPHATDDNRVDRVISVPLDPAKTFNVFVRVTTLARRPVTTMERSVSGQALLELPVKLAPGTYRVNVVKKEADAPPGAVTANTEYEITVP